MRANEPQKGSAMYCYVWEFTVVTANRAAFEAAYGDGGPWVELFRRDAAYLGTDLLCDLERPGRYLTIDRWTSRDACLAFRERWRAAFDALDAECERLTESERSLGEYETPGPGAGQIGRPSRGPDPT